MIIIQDIATDKNYYKPIHIFVITSQLKLLTLSFLFAENVFKASSSIFSELSSLKNYRKILTFGVFNTSNYYHKHFHIC